MKKYKIVYNNPPLVCNYCEIYRDKKEAEERLKSLSHQLNLEKEYSPKKLSWGKYEIIEYEDEQ